MLPSRNLKHKLATYSSKSLATTFVATLIQIQGWSVRLSPSEVGRNRRRPPRNHKRRTQMKRKRNKIKFKFSLPIHIKKEKY
ncbi:hypothetical protein AHAS_Ahas04G0099800 [Arachis hypogaea]